MIDTIKFRFKLTDKQIKAIKKKSIEFNKYDHNYNSSIYNIYTSKVKIGSYDRHINIFINADYPGESYLEFSIPKYLYGHNVYLYYPYKFNEDVKTIYTKLLYTFGDFPDMDTWIIIRLDLCYIWKLPTQKKAEELLNLINCFKISRKKQHQYDLDILQTGSSYSVKWYLKHNEYITHDLKELLKLNLTDYAYHILNVSEGILRFEITMRSKCIEQWFGQKCKVSLIDYDYCEKILQFYFKKFFNGVIPVFTDQTTVVNLLINKYGKLQAKSIYYYYLALLSKDPQSIYNLKKFNSDRAIRDYRTKLRRAGIGLITKDFDFPFDFKIPSTNTANFNNPPPAGGGWGLVTPSE